VCHGQETLAHGYKELAVDRAEAFLEDYSGD
jgi:hypothetical protein